MSRAEEAKLDSVTENQIIQTAWKDHAGNTPPDDRYVAMLFGIRAGYARGRADAWQLPEVRAEELEEGKYYFAQWANGKRDDGTVIRVSKWREGNTALWITGDEREVESRHFQRFRGPLPLGGV